MTQTTEQSRAENNDCHETFVNKFCPYSGSPDPWQAAWQAARASVVPEDVLIYFQSIYVFIKSVAPYGFAEEVFRLPAGSTRNQKALLDAIKNNAFGELPQTQGKIGEREDQDARTFKVKTTTNHFRDVTKTMTDDQIRAIFLENGFTIKEGMTDLKPYVYQAARALLATGGQAQALAEKAAKYDHLLPYLCKTCGGYGLVDRRCNDDPLGSEPCPDCNAAPQPAAQRLVERDEAFEAVRKAFCKLQRYSFFLDGAGNVRRCADHCGNWVEFEAVHTLFEPQSVDAALAAQAEKGGAV